MDTHTHTFLPWQTLPGHNLVHLHIPKLALEKCRLNPLNPPFLLPSPPLPPPSPPLPHPFPPLPPPLARFLSNSDSRIRTFFAAPAAAWTRPAIFGRPGRAAPSARLGVVFVGAGGGCPTGGRKSRGVLEYLIRGGGGWVWGIVECLGLAYFGLVVF